MAEIQMLSVPNIMVVAVKKVATKRNVSFEVVFQQALELLIIGLEYQRASTPLMWDYLPQCLQPFLPDLMVDRNLITALGPVPTNDRILELVNTLVQFTEKGEQALEKRYIQAASVLGRTENRYRVCRLIKLDKKAPVVHMRVPVDMAILPPLFQAHSKS